MQNKQKKKIKLNISENKQREGWKLEFTYVNSTYLWYN